MRASPSTYRLRLLALFVLFAFAAFIGVGGTALGDAHAAGTFGTGSCTPQPIPADNPCQGNTGTIGANSCNGPHACENNGFNGAGTIGNNSCNGSAACFDNGLAGSGTVGSNSCNGSQACYGNALSGTGTVGNNSCNGAAACVQNGGAGGTGTIGNDSCNGSATCLGNPSTVGNCAQNLVTVPVCAVTTLKTTVLGSGALLNIPNKLASYLKSAESYLAVGSPTMKAAACQQLSLFKFAVMVAMRQDSVVLAQGPTWISQADAIRGSIPCPGTVVSAP